MPKNYLKSFLKTAVLTIALGANFFHNSLNSMAQEKNIKNNGEKVGLAGIFTQQYFIGLLKKINIENIYIKGQKTKIENILALYGHPTNEDNTAITVSFSKKDLDFDDKIISQILNNEDAPRKHATNIGLLEFGLLARCNFLLVEPKIVQEKMNFPTVKQTVNSIIQAMKFNLTALFFECEHPNCLNKTIRETFEKNLLQKAQSLKKQKLKYASIASGNLLPDYMILKKLIHAGIKIQTIYLIDLDYDIKTLSQIFDQKINIDSILNTNGYSRLIIKLTQLSLFTKILSEIQGEPIQVILFNSTNAYQNMCKENQENKADLVSVIDLDYQDCSLTHCGYTDEQTRKNIKEKVKENRCVHIFEKYSKNFSQKNFNDLKKNEQENWENENLVSKIIFDLSTRNGLLAILRTIDPNKYQEQDNDYQEFLKFDEIFLQKI